MEESGEESSIGTVEPVSIVSEMQRSYIDYSMSVIIGRALPDARDGLKPVHRRILYTMRELGNTHNRPYKKSARVVGDVMGKYHPHGDSSIYDAAARMAQDFSLRYLLVDGQGNFGSLDGDRPAAMRYTEVRMDRLAEELLADIDKNTVDFAPNYDDSLTEPSVLPARVPNLLLNGSTGIAVGMATNIPPHNLREIIDALIHLIGDPDATVDDLMTYVKGPDFPTGATVCGMRGILNMYRTGRGQMKMRCKADIETDNAGKNRIIVTEIPFAVNKAVLLENIAKAVNGKVIEGISDLRDESNKDGIRIVIELKKAAVPKVVLSNLYKHSNLQCSFGAIMLAIDKGRPRVMNLCEILACFIEHRFDVITRRTQFELAKAEARAHILEGLKLALDHLDAIVKLIRESSNRDDARAQLIETFSFSTLQANAILEMRLYQLTGLERDKIDEEHEEVVKLINYYRDLLASDSKVYAVMTKELEEIRDAYGDERRTELVPDEGEVNIEDLIADRECVITMSHSGYIKRVPLDTYREQRRGGKGVAGMDVKADDIVDSLFMASTHDTLLFFTSTGRVYYEKVYEIPESQRTSRGKAIVNLLNLREDERIAAMIRVREFSEDQFLVLATAKGILKKSSLSAYRNIRRDGIIAINIDEGDRLIGVRLTSGDDGLILATCKGLSLRCAETDLRPMGRATRGVKGISLAADDSVLALNTVAPDATFLVVTENGYGKRTNFDEYRGQKRGGKGVFTIRTSERNGVMIGAYTVTDADSLMLITVKGKVIRMAVKDVRVISRVTQGVRLIHLDEGDRLVSATPVGAGDVEEEGDAETSVPGPDGETTGPDAPEAAADEPEADA